MNSNTPVDPIHLPAYGFAQCAHLRQRRKYTGEPYATHCLAVARTVAQHTDDIDVISAALLHDVVEDTDIAADEIQTEFGARVARLVLEVTDVSRPEDGNRPKRKELDRMYLARSSPEGATIKLADLIDNTSSVVAGDAKFAAVYLREKEALLPCLEHGAGELMGKARAVLAEAQGRLAEVAQP